MTLGKRQALVSWNCCKPQSKTKRALMCSEPLSSMITSCIQLGVSHLSAQDCSWGLFPLGCSTLVAVPDYNLGMLVVLHEDLMWKAVCLPRGPLSCFYITCTRADLHPLVPLPHKLISLVDQSVHTEDYCPYCMCKMRCAIQLPLLHVVALGKIRIIVPLWWVLGYWRWTGWLAGVVLRGTQPKRCPWLKGWVKWRGTTLGNGMAFLSLVLHSW